MPQLTNNSGTLTLTNQKNTITLGTQNTFVNSDIELTTKVTKAVLNTTSGDTDRKTFQIQVPNGSANDNIIFTFTVNSNGFVVVE